jgi:uncharacterized protein (DUF2252 family)
MPKNIVKRIYRYNKARDPKLVKAKYDALLESPFRFFRGTCHLFYEDLPKKSFLLQSPRAWICGDLHLENFGSFQGDNRLAYFDMNDFDESFLGPCLLDVVRCSTSVFLATDMVKLEVSDCHEPVRRFLKAYAQTLSTGLIRSVEKETAAGVIGKMMEAVANRTRKALLDKKVDFKGKRPFIKIDGLKSIAIGKEKKRAVKFAVEQWAQKHARRPEFFDVFDVAGRGIGTGSIGIERYLVLVNGKGAPDGLHMLDVKEALPPSALQYLHFKQPAWANEAERLIGIQKRVQAANPAFLTPFKLGKKWFTVKELQPLEDKIDFTSMDADEEKLTNLLVTMGNIVAWNNLRSGGRQNSAIADTMIRFGEKLYKIEDEIMEYAEGYAGTVRKYYKEFKKEYKPGKK